MKKLLRLVLVGSGATMIVSAATGIYSAYALIEPTDAKDIGLTPGDFVGFYAVMILFGAGMVFAGLRLKK